MQGTLKVKERYTRDSDVRERPHVLKWGNGGFATFVQRKGGTRWWNNKSEDLPERPRLNCTAKRHMKIMNRVMLPLKPQEL